MSEKRILMLGTGAMARAHAQRFSLMPGLKLVAAVDMNDERARDFAAGFQIPTAFGSLAEAIAWGQLDAAINSTPDGAHKATTMDLLAAGKAVLCEKPLALNHPDALAMTEAAEAAGLMNMVNLAYRNAAAIQMARRMVEAGEIGEVRHVQGSYLQSWLTGRHWATGEPRSAGSGASPRRTGPRECSGTSACTSSTSSPSAPPSTSSPCTPACAPSTRPTGA